MQEPTPPISHVTIMQETLRAIAAQKRSDELPAEKQEHADYEGAYNIIINNAREALKAAEALPDSPPTQHSRLNNQEQRTENREQFLKIDHSPNLDTTPPNR